MKKRRTESNSICIYYFYGRNFSRCLLCSTHFFSFFSVDVRIYAHILTAIYIRKSILDGITHKEEKKLLYMPLRYFKMIISRVRNCPREEQVKRKQY